MFSFICSKMKIAASLLHLGDNLRYDAIFEICWQINHYYNIPFCFGWIQVHDKSLWPLFFIDWKYPLTASSFLLRRIKKRYFLGDDLLSSWHQHRYNNRVLTQENLESLCLAHQSPSWQDVDKSLTRNKISLGIFLKDLKGSNFSHN